MKYTTKHALALAITCLCAIPAFAIAPPPEAPDTGSAKVDVVFVLDTTGSMGGLIEAAKEKIWAIANTLALAEPAPDIRMGLVAYRDRNDDYITQLTSLTDDLDAVYSNLMKFNANGGDDTPESVNQALHEAVTKMDWRKEDDTYRVIFLVGDAPPHMDYENEVQYPASCKAAAEAGIYVNTIQCGDIAETEPIWREIASKAEGRFFRVEQSGSAILAETPFDAELAELGKQIESTRAYYGNKEIVQQNLDRLETAAGIEAAASDSAKARRAAFNNSAGGAKNFYGTQELVQDFAEGNVKLEDLDAEELPEEYRGKSQAEVEAILKEKAEEREQLQQQITDLTQKRQAHIEEQLKKTALQGKGSLDHNIFECIQAQAVKAGLQYKGGPAL